MLSALARSPMGHQLLDFVAANGLPPDWEEPSRFGVSAFVTGRKLDNRLGANAVIQGSVNDEILVHLESPHGKCTLNLNTLLALATAFVEQQYNLAAVAVTDSMDKTTPEEHAAPTPE